MKAIINTNNETANEIKNFLATWTKGRATIKTGSNEKRNLCITRRVKEMGKNSWMVLFKADEEDMLLELQDIMDTRFYETTEFYVI